VPVGSHRSFAGQFTVQYMVFDIYLDERFPRWVELLHVTEETVSMLKTPNVKLENGLANEYEEPTEEWGRM
jgi:hypothetical protein